MAKKIHQLPVDNNFNKNRKLFSGNPSTGQLYQITFDDVRNLVLAPDKVQLSGNGTYLVVAGNMVSKIIITPLSNSTIKVGTVADSDDIFPETLVPGGTDHILRIDISARTNKTLFFSGIVSNTTIAVYLEKL